MDIASEHFSARDLASFGLPGYPKTERGWTRLVEREHWPHKTVKGKGGPGGIRREYQPPTHVMELIEALTKEPLIVNLPAGIGKSMPKPPLDRKTLVVTGRESKPAAIDISTEDGYIDRVPPKISGAALKCPQCGGFTGLIRTEGRVILEFDPPDARIFLLIVASVLPALTPESAEADYAFIARVYSFLSLLTAGDPDAISRYLRNPRLVEALVALSRELNTTLSHGHTTDAPTNKVVQD